MDSFWLMWYFKEGFQMFGCSLAYKTWSFTKFFYFKVNASIQVCFFSVEKLPAETMNQIFLQIDQLTTSTNYIWWFVGFSNSKRWITKKLTSYDPAYQHLPKSWQLGLQCFSLPLQHMYGELPIRKYLRKIKRRTKINSLFLALNYKF